MSLLPNFQVAYIPDEKIYGYCLNVLHEQGKHKARMFKRVLGISANEGELLKQAIIHKLPFSPISQIRENRQGIIYTVPLNIRIFDKEADVITAWIIEYDYLIPRLITCFVNV